MKYTIEKGRHNASPFQFQLFWNFRYRLWTVFFYPSCKYNLEGSENTNTGDDWDVNKLIGIGFFSLRWPPHHYESIRVGWLWNPEKQKIELYSYAYIKGKRFIKHLIDVNWGESIKISIAASSSEYSISVVNPLFKSNATVTAKIARGIKPKLSYLLGLYFGGNRKAPKDIVISVY